MTDDIDEEQRVQEKQYSFPYHYIPSFDDGFSQTRHWSWGYRYLGGIDAVLDQLERISFRSLVDVGCGDGRFVREVADRYPDVRLLGVDHSERPIQIARALNPDLDFEQADITVNPPDERFDVATAIEVLEHIPPDELPEFVEQIAELVVPGGQFIGTVPHENKDVNPKHYQHFSSTLLNDLLSSSFSSVTIIPIHSLSKILSALEMLIGGNGDHFVITNSMLLQLFYTIYRKQFLYPDSKINSGRLLAVCQQ